MTHAGNLIVVGSINMDLVARVREIPRPGQTVVGDNLQEHPGGKGANQAVGVARLGGRCTLVGCVGTDVFGTRLIQSLAGHGVHTERIRLVEGCSSGVALISVSEQGENAITIVPGANARLTPADVIVNEDAIRQAAVLLLQLEVPFPTVEAAAQLARKHGVRIILDPAPVSQALPPALFDVDVMCPNELEAQALTGTEDPEEAARLLHERGVRCVLITLGEKGVLVCDEQHSCEVIPAFGVQAVDSTAAGDAFAAGVGLSLAEGQSLARAVRLGCAAGALAATRAGAQQAMPTRAEVEELLSDC
jgi:ribokinase